jgi:Ca2+-binding EF-hand superfamily protein
MTDPDVKALMLEEFKKLDTDKSGFIDGQEIKKWLRNQFYIKLTDAEVDRFIRVADKNGDGKVSFEEYFNLLSEWSNAEV